MLPQKSTIALLCAVFALVSQRPAAFASATSTAYERGLGHYLFEQYDQALKEFSLAVKQNPRDALALMERGATYANLERIGDALKDLNQSIAVDPGNWRAYSWRSYCYLRSGNTARGLADLNKAIAIWKPEIGDVERDFLYFNRAKVLDKLGKHDQANADRLMARKVELLTGAKTLRESGNTKRALAVANEAIRQLPRDPSGYWIKACLLLNDGNYQEAQYVLSEGIRLAPAFTPLYYLRAEAYSELGKSDLAIADYATILKLKPRLAAYRFVFETGRFRGDDQKPDNGAVNMADIHILRARVYATKRDYTHAAADYGAAIVLDTREREAYLGRAKALVSLKHYGQAVKDFEKAITLNPKQVDAYLERAKMYEATGQKNKAELDYNKIVEGDRTAGGGYYLRGQFFERSGQFKSAIADYSTDIGLDAQDEQSILARADLYQRMGDFAQARLDYQRALTILPKGKALYKKVQAKLSSLDRSAH